MDKKISELDQALQINNDAVFPMSQDNGGEDTTYKASITQLSTEIGEGQTFSNLQTTNKTLVGAINELLTLGNPIIIGTTAPTAQQGDNGNMYVQYTEGVGGADDTVDGIFIKLDGAWCEIQTGGGGSGGHIIVDDSGTDLPQRTNLQFVGTYSEDNSGDDTTEVYIVRSMTKAQYNQLPAAEKMGLVNITDETLDATQLPIESGSATNTKEYIDNKVSTINTALSGKVNTTALSVKSKQTTTALSVSANSYYTHNFSVDNAVFGIICGVAITTNTEIVLMQAYFNSLTDIQIRVKNVSSSTQSFNLSVFYI